MTAAYRFAFLAALATCVACTVHGDRTPPLAGPSEFALSITVTATPDSIAQDGASQAAIAVTARDVNGQGIESLRLRIDMALGNSVQDYGILSSRTVTTGRDGLATVIYTAPPPPPSLAGGSGTLVSFNVTPIGSNYQTAHSVSAAIRLVPPGVVLPSASTPTAVFAVTPTPLLAGVAANFDASRSCATAAPCSSTAGITSFSWTFGDGTSGSGQTTTHTYATASSHQVTLTVTNDRGISGFASQTVGVTASALPTADFAFSPTNPQVVGTAPAIVGFNGSASAAAPGRTLSQFTWDFGDGLSGSGPIVQHPYQLPGTYAVVLTVIDDLGSKATKTNTLTVTGNLPTADFVFSPNNPEAPAVINFNADTSRATAGHTLTRFLWNFGDGSGNVTGPSLIAHTYTVAGSYTVALTVFDDVGQQAIVTKQVSVGTGLPTADFVFSPTDPTLPAAGPVTVNFNASSSRATAGHNIVTFTWDFGGGSGSPSGSSASATYSAAGSYTVVLTVTDELGRSASASKAVTVKAYTPPIP